VARNTEIYLGRCVAGKWGGGGYLQLCLSYLILRCCSVAMSEALITEYTTNNDKFTNFNINILNEHNAIILTLV
jgi:hypothetical protein